MLFWAVLETLKRVALQFASSVKQRLLFHISTKACYQ